MGDGEVTLEVERFTFAKLSPGNAVSPQAVIARSPGIAEQQAWQVLAEVSLGATTHWERTFKAISFVCTPRWAVGALSQALLDPRGGHYLATHCVLIAKHNFLALGANFRYLIDLLPEHIPLSQEFQVLPALRCKVSRSISREIHLVQRMLEALGVVTLQRLLEPYFTGSSVAHIGFRAESKSKLDLLEALALLVPPPLRQAMSFSTDVASAEECPLRAKFVPRPMAGLKGHFIVLWGQAPMEFIGSSWDRNDDLRRCCGLLEEFIRAQRLADYLRAIEEVIPSDAPSDHLTLDRWSRLLGKGLEPFLFGRVHRQAASLPPGGQG